MIYHLVWCWLWELQHWTRSSCGPWDLLSRDKAGKCPTAGIVFRKFCGFRRMDTPLNCLFLPTRWTWVWVSSGIWWWTGRPGVLRFTGSQRVGHDWATELNWTELIFSLSQLFLYTSCFMTQMKDSHCKKEEERREKKKKKEGKKYQRSRKHKPRCCHH